MRCRVYRICVKEKPTLHYTSSHTQYRTTWSRVFLKTLLAPQLFKKFYAFYGTWRFIKAFTSARHLSLSWTREIQPMPPHPTSWKSILLLPSHLCLGHPSGLLPSGLSTKTVYTPYLSPIVPHAPAHLIFLDLITWNVFGREYRSWSSSLCCRHSLSPCPS